MICLARTESETVTQVEYCSSQHFYIAVKAEVHLFIAEGCTVYYPVALVVIILVKAVIQVVRCHTVHKYVCSVRTTTLFVATLFEAVTINTYRAVLKISVPYCPAVFYHAGVCSIVKVPSVVTISPAAVSVPLVARSRIEFISKTVGISSVALHIIVVV